MCHNQKQSLAAGSSKAIKEARLVEGKFALFWMPAMSGGGGRGIILLSMVNSPAHPNKQTVTALMGFPGRSTGKDSTHSAGDSTSISGSGRSPREGIGYPLQYPWVSLVVQTVRNLPGRQKPWVQTLGWEIPWRRAWQRPAVWTEEPGGLQSMGLKIVRND